MSDQDVNFSGSVNTMVALAMLAAVLALALSAWNLNRIAALEAFVTLQAVAESQDAGGS